MSNKIDISGLLKNLLAYLIILLVLVIEGCFSFVDLEFHIEQFQTTEFWVSITFNVFLLVAVKSAAILIFVDIARNKNVDLKNARILNDKYMKLKGADFPIFIDTIKNQEIKAEYWKAQVSRKLVKLEKKASIEDRQLYYSKDLSAEKENNSYCKQRRLLEEQSSDTYIKENINTLIIDKRYPRIDAAVFGLPVISSDIGKKYQVSAKTKTALAGSIVLSAFLAIISQSIRRAIGMSPTDVNAVEVVVSIMTDLVFIIIQFWSGMLTAFSKIQSEEVTPYVNRNEILKEYLYWKDGGGHDNFSKWIKSLEQIEETST